MKKDPEWYEFARITDESGDFNEECEVSQAKAMLKAGILKSYDGKDNHGYCVEYYYTVEQERESSVVDWLKRDSKELCFP